MGQEGFSLIAAILAMLGLAVMGSAFASVVTQQQHTAVTQLRAARALYLAEAGFELAIQELMDGTDQAFNGAAPDGVIGGVTAVPLGSGTVTVTSSGAVPPVLTSTGEVVGVRRALQMTVDAKNLVTQDWTFPTTANLPVTWPETGAVQAGTWWSGLASPAVNGLRFSGDGTTSFKVRVDDQNAAYFAYREQAVTIPANRRLTVRLDFKKNYSFGTGQPQSQDLAVLLWRSGDGSSQTVWSDGSKSNTNIWETVDLRGVTTGSPAFDRVRIRHDLVHNASAKAWEYTEAWLDNVSVSLVDRSGWKEP